MKKRRLITMTEKDKDRFWSKVDKSGGPDSCWPWMAARLKPLGYGIFMLSGKTVRANRVSLTLEIGSIPDELNACHHCDNPPCCNQAHLFAGTMKQNLQDASSKGRCAVQRYPGLTQGENNGSAKLNDLQVLEIFHSSKQSVVLAKQYGVDRQSIERIWGGRTWSHLTGAR